MFVVKTGDGRTRPATLPGGIADCGLRCVQRSRPRQYHCADRRRPVRTRSSPSPAVTRSSPAVLWGEARDGIQNGDPVHGYPLGVSLSGLSQVDAVSKPVLICDRFLGGRPSIVSGQSFNHHTEVTCGALESSLGRLTIRFFPVAPSPSCSLLQLG